MPLPPGDNLSFIIREAIHITDDIHRKELIRIIKDGGFQFLPLDVLGRMTGDCEHFGKDIHRILGAIEEIQFETQATIQSVDHIRKPQGLNKGRNTQEANPFDLYGGIQKYGAAEFILSLAKAEDNRLKIRIENKDHDEEFNFWLKVSSKGSPDPKFVWDGDIESAARNMKEKGDQNQRLVLDAFNPLNWYSRGQILGGLDMSPSTVSKHIKTLLEAGKLVSRGSGRHAEYKSISEEQNTPLRTMESKSLFGEV
jgi:DNA-binding transcriptional ArsR family regulator